MPFREAIRLALQVVWTNKMKSAFSIVGVFIGVTFLIAVATVVEGMDTYMTERVAGNFLGANTFQLRRFADFQAGETSRETWRQWLRRPRIEYSDASAAAAAITVPVAHAWESTTGTSVEHGGRQATSVRVIGASEGYFDVRNWVIEQGRPFSPQEASAGIPVAVIGFDLAEKLFEDLDPLGRDIKIRGLPYRVVGVVESQGTVFGFSLDNFAVAPALSPVKRFVNPPRVLDQFLVKANSEEDMRTAMAEVEAVMRSRRGLRPGQENNFVLESAEGVLEFWNQIKRILMAVGPALVSTSLVVGAIVIMNIMLMAVAERTREIGIRKSLGARRSDILRQFLVESATLATVGAAVGIGVGLAAAGVIDATTPLPTSVSPAWIVAAVALGAGVGIVAGLYPAARAARLDPVVAMRQE